MTTNKGYFTKNPLPYGKRLAPRKDSYARPTDHRVEYQIFSSDYFSGADVKIYFGDIWVDEITNLAFQLQENVMPIYGYNSYTFDTVARGRRQVNGMFTLNFTTVGYLNEILANANAIFYALEQGEKKGLVKPSYYEDMKLGDILAKLGKSSFDQIADEYEQAIWGTKPDTNEAYLGYADRPYFRQDELGFDIRIQYGAVSEATGYVNGRFYQSVKEEPPNMTVDVLNGVQLTGLSKSMGTDQAGAPILEQYSFMARDFNGVGMAQIARTRKAEQGSTGDIETVYRRMQYGVIR